MKVFNLFLILLLFSCTSQKKLAQICADRFPIKENVKEILLIDTLINTDTIKIEYKGDSIVLPCPPSKTIIQTKEVLKTLENTAKIEALKIEHQKEMQEYIKEYNLHEEKHEKEIEKLKKDLNKAEEKVERVSKFKRWFYFLLFGIILYFVIHNSRFRFPL
jgi:hypothetical protein